MRNRVLFRVLFLSTLVISCVKEPQPIHVTGITLNSSTLELVEGETADLVATVSPKDADNQTIIWSSSNGSVASVNNGRVTAIKAGSTSIIAKSDDGSYTASCSVTVSPRTIEVTSVTLSKTELSLVEGDSETITATVSPDNATDKTVTWTSSDTAVATVENGKITAIKEGSATITAKAGDKSATCAVKVEKKVIPVESISLNKSELDLVKGNSETLVATVKPDDATDKTVTWSSSNSSVAIVDQNGKVTAVDGGNATITAIAGDKSATCTVTVTVPVESIELNKTSISLTEGDTETLVATVKPDNATDKTVTWTSSNNAVATVENGRVKSIKEGSATITAKAGNKSATCVVKVEKKVIPVTSIALNKSEVTLVKGNSETLAATVKPDDATDKTVMWSSSNTSVATVDQNGKVTAVDGGNATITAIAGDKSATCTVTVIVPVESIKLNKTELSLKKGTSETLTATIQPSNATDKTITWSSSNTSVAKVDQNGKVTAVDGGSATITASAGGLSSTCTVTVTVPVESIKLNKTELSLKKGTSETLTATIQPSNATDKTITWSSSNTSVATVDQNGKVIAVDGGNATITAKAGDKSATCTVTVTIPVTSVALNKTKLTLAKGKAETLVATVNPSEATDKSVTWSSSNTAVATVDQNGKVSAIKEGTATITVTTNEGSKKATCEVTVQSPGNTEPINDDGEEHGWD